MLQTYHKRLSIVKAGSLIHSKKKRENSMVRLKVKEVAENKGFNMSSLARRADIAFTTVKKIFRDPYAEVSTYTLDKLAKALEVDVRELIESVPDEDK
jgi:DNA-binding Xre family transcriptional regulator